MGCCASQPAPHVQRALDVTAGDAQMSSAAAAPSPKTHAQRSRHELPTHSPDGWLCRPDELKHKLLHTPITDRRVDDYLTAVVNVAKRSYQQRVLLGQALVVQQLCAALARGAATTAKLAAQALKLLSFCHDNHRRAPLELAADCGGTLAERAPALLQCSQHVHTLIGHSKSCLGCGLQFCHCTHGSYCLPRALDTHCARAA
jgi:hypothetical protein